MPDEIEHFGVKGMHWGVRKERNTPNGGYSESRRKQDRARFGRGGERRINRHLNEGKTYKEAVKREGITFVARRAAIVGGTYAALIVAQHGDQIVSELGSRITQRAQTNRGRAAMADLRGLAAETPVSFIKPNRKGVYKITDL
jgi:hypothetical protein